MSENNNFTSQVVDWTELTLTYRCNQRCFFCYEEYRDIAVEPDIAHVKQLLTETKKHAEQVVLCGKEVLLRPDILDIVKVASDMGLRTVIFTNGQELSQPDLIEQLIKAGSSSIAISFHFPDAEIFEIGSRTHKKGFARFIKGLQNIREYNKIHADQPVQVSTETDMFILNQGRLIEMRQTLIDNLGDTKWKMRIGSLLPSKLYDIGLKSILAPFKERKEELKQFIATHPSDIPLKFVKVPLCILPEEQAHNSLDVDYVYHDTLLTYNHAIYDKVTIDDISASTNRQLEKQLRDFPYRWICRKCDLISMCRFQRLDWRIKGFEPNRLQKPEPFKNLTARQLLSRLGSREEGLKKVEIINNFLQTEVAFPEETIIEQLLSIKDQNLKVTDVWAPEKPGLGVEFEINNEKIQFNLLLPTLNDNAERKSYILDYIMIEPVIEKSVSREIVLACLKRFIGLKLPPIDAWKQDSWFDMQSAILLKQIWNLAKNRIWPKFGKFGNWFVDKFRILNSQTIQFNLIYENRVSVLLTIRVQGEAENENMENRLNLRVCVTNCNDVKVFPINEYRKLLQIISIVFVKDKSKSEHIPVTDIVNGSLEAYLSRRVWSYVKFEEFNDTSNLKELRFRVSVLQQTSEPVMLFINPYLKGNKYFKKVGDLTLTHGNNSESELQQLFAKVLISAMKFIKTFPVDDTELLRWNKTINLILKKARLDNRFKWQLQLVLPKE